MAVRRAFKWSIHLYDGLTYLRVLADPLLPILTTSKWCLETTSTPHLPPGGKKLPYLPSRSGKLTWPQLGKMIANSSLIQANHAQTNSAPSPDSGVKFPDGRGNRRHAQSHFDLWIWYSALSSIAHSQIQSFWYPLCSRRWYLKDVSSFGMQLVALSLPDLILSGWSSNSRDCLWRAVTHDCACVSAKLSIASFPSLSFCCSPKLEKFTYNENWPTAPQPPKTQTIITAQSAIHCDILYISRLEQWGWCWYLIRLQGKLGCQNQHNLTAHYSKGSADHKSLHDTMHNPQAYCIVYNYNYAHIGQDEKLNRLLMKIKVAFTSFIAAYKNIMNYHRVKWKIVLSSAPCAIYSGTSFTLTSAESNKSACLCI